MSQALSDLLYRFYDDEEAMVCIISGNGRAFCSGADVKQRQLRPVEELKRLGGAAGRDGNIRQPFFKPPRAKPIIAAMHGYAYGVGIRIALCADMTVASKGTKFQVTGVVHGINGIPLDDAQGARLRHLRRRRVLHRSRLDRRGGLRGQGSESPWPSRESTSGRPRSWRRKS